MTEFDEGRVYERNDRRTGAVLIIGAGAVGGFLAEELSRTGISPLVLVDKDKLEPQNLIRHPLGADDLHKPKASALASRIRRDFPLCDAHGIDADFLALSEAEQLLLVGEADVVVAATDMFECQRQVNRACLTAEVTSVFPAVWVDPRLRDAEVGEILWTVGGRHTPCFECAVAFRQAEPDAQAGRGSRADIQQLALTTASVVFGLLDRTDPRAAMLDPERTCIYVHGFTPTSQHVERTFPTQGLRNVNVHIPFPATPCPACGGHQAPPQIWHPADGFTPTHWREPITRTLPRVNWTDAQASQPQGRPIRTVPVRIVLTAIVAASIIVCFNIIDPTEHGNPNTGSQVFLAFICDLWLIFGVLPSLLVIWVMGWRRAV